LRHYERRCRHDYRLRTLTQAHLWLSPLNAQTQQQMDKLWLALAGAKREQTPTLEINHRPLPTLGVKTRRWRPRLLRCAWMRAASTITSRFASVPYRDVV
jgi:predicted ATPase